MHLDPGTGKAMYLNYYNNGTIYLNGTSYYISNTGANKLGSTTGYPRQVMARLMTLAADQGYAPDCTVCADDLEAGARPGPWMALDCVRQLKVGAVSHCVKVDDTVPGIEEGLNAGMWTVGLALSGSPAGWSLTEYRAATDAQRAAERKLLQKDRADLATDFNKEYYDTKKSVAKGEFD